jgi:hypothetical protein
MTTKAQAAPAEQREYLLGLFDRMTPDQREEYLREARQLLGLPTSEPEMVAVLATPLPTNISPTLAERLHREGVESCEQWVALKNRRKLIFGVPARAVREVDAAVTAELSKRERT